MKWPNAIGFCLVGLTMLWLPVLAPGFLTSSSAMGMGAGQLWLQFMGSINTSLGAGVLGWQAIRQASRMPVWLKPVGMPAATAETRPGALPQPSRA
jgi:hypothetical protein